MPLIPYVIEKSGREERAMDIYSRLLKDRIVFLGSGRSTTRSPTTSWRNCLFLQSDDPKATSTCTSTRPAAASRRAWRFTTRCSSSPATWRPTASASARDGRRAAGRWRRRQASRPAERRIMIHQPLAGMEGTAEDILIHATEYRKTKEKLNNILPSTPAKTMEQIELDIPTATTSCRNKALDDWSPPLCRFPVLRS
jgi:ATP-dependent Clp protease protease subunit